MWKERKGRKREEDDLGHGLSIPSPFPFSRLAFRPPFFFWSSGLSVCKDGGGEVVSELVGCDVIIPRLHSDQLVPSSTSPRSSTFPGVIPTADHQQTGTYLPSNCLVIDCGLDRVPHAERANPNLHGKKHHYTRLVLMLIPVLTSVQLSCVCFC